MKAKRQPLSPEAREQWFNIDYKRLLAEFGLTRPGVPSAKFLVELPYAWREVYEPLTPRVINPCFISNGSFEYLFDDYDTLIELGKVPAVPAYESRMIAAFGYSTPPSLPRKDTRLKGWVGPTQKAFGPSWDKGHFIAHSMGGSVDHNIFVQHRWLNRGWSDQGKLYRSMERYCFENPNTFCFARPIYSDTSAVPAMVEFGVLKADGEWWVEHFENG